MTPLLQDRETLLRRRNELRERLDAIRAGYRRGLNGGREHRAQQFENAEVLNSIAAAAELVQVEKALARNERRSHEPEAQDTTPRHSA